MQNTVNLLNQAAQEISILRQQNTLMAARLDVFDKMVSIFESSPRSGHNGLMRPDIVVELRRESELLSKEIPIPSASENSINCGMKSRDI